jgi:P27 family predicted phage terminase small subunit
MRPGPAPKPTAFRIAEGNRSHRPLNKREPQPALGVPQCPKWLTAEAKREWKRITPELDNLGLLAHVDQAALAGYCQCFARWQEAEKFIEEHGTVCTMRDDKGNVKWTQPVPQVGIATKMMDRMHRFAAEFGLTPASRTRIQVSSGAPGMDALDEAIFGCMSRPCPSELAMEAAEKENRLT